MTKKRRGHRKRRTGNRGSGGFSGWIKTRAMAFVHAGRGIAAAVKTQPNFQIHLLATVVVVTLGFVFQVSAGDWIALLLCIGSVLAAEAFNTAMESIADALSTEKHPLIGRAKDTAAAAVLILATMSVAVGTLVFWPHLFS